jgi:hypothetical protein
VDEAWRSVEPMPGYRKRGLSLTHLFR